MNEDVGLRVQATWDRSLVWYRGASVRYLQVEVTASQRAEEKLAIRLPLNLALVLDVSGSMQGEPLAAAQQAAHGVIAQLGEQDRLSVVSFADDIQTHVLRGRMDAAGRQQAQAQVAALHTRGSTHLAGGWLRGAECVAEGMETSAATRNQVLVLTDGHANVGLLDPAVLAEHAAALLERGISSSTVGIGDGYSPEQIQAIADAGGGRMHDAERPAELIEVVLAELLALGNEVVAGIQVQIDCPPGVTLRCLSAFPTQRQPAQLVTTLGALASGASRYGVFRADLPAGVVDEELAFRVQVQWRMTDSGQARQFGPLSVPLRYARGRVNNAQPRQEAVARQVAEVWQAAVIREVLRLNRSGDFQGAADHVLRQLRHFERYCAGLPEGEAWVAALRRTAQRITQPLRERSRKEIELALYKRNRSEGDVRMSYVRPAWEAYLEDPPEV